MSKFNALDYLEMLVNFILLLVTFFIVSFFANEPITTTFFIVVLIIAPLSLLTKETFKYFFNN